MARRLAFPAASVVRAAKGAILLIQTDSVLRQIISELLTKEGHQVTTASCAADALSLAVASEFELVLTDWVLPDMGGEGFFERIGQVDPDLPVIVFTESGKLEMAVHSIRAGAYDYLSAPPDIQALLVMVNHALEQRRLRGEVRVLRRQVGGREMFGALVGRSEPMQSVYRRIAKIAPHDSTVLVLGESGTGKEMVAREVHRRSPMSDGPFVAVNCGGVPADLIESEMFGHERGAFTGANEARDGLFQAASGGTLFLDEIGAMPMAQQSSLLRVLQEKEVRRVGGTRMMRVNVRLVAATNTDLDEAMEAGTFRQDLYYRLSAMTINLPSLRERVADIPILCSHFLERCSQEHGRPHRRLSPQTLDILCNRRWPGNVRELQHVIEQAVLFSQQEILRPSDLPFRAGGAEEAQPETLEQVDRRHICFVLSRTAGNKLKAARILGIPRPTLYHRMKKLRIADTWGAAPGGSA